MPSGGSEFGWQSFLLMLAILVTSEPRQSRPAFILCNVVQRGRLSRQCGSMITSFHNHQPNVVAASFFTHGLTKRSATP